MAEKIISPGVFTNEIDQSFLPAAVSDIGAALIGPTVKGPAGVPTIVTSFSDFQQKFGDVFKSGSTSVQYLTSHTAEQYLKNSDTLTVVRVLDGAYGPASTNDTIGSQAVVAGATKASGSYLFTAIPSGSHPHPASSSRTPAADFIKIGSTKFTFVSSSVVQGYENSATQIFVGLDYHDGGILSSTSGTGSIATTFRDHINNSSSLHQLGISASVYSSIGTGSVLLLSGSSAGTAGNLTVITGSGGTEVAFTTGFFKPVENLGGGAFGISEAHGMNIQGGTDTTTTGTSFKLQTIADGEIMNNSGSALAKTNNVLHSGSQHNIRWEI